MPSTLALLAHSSQQDTLVAWTQEHQTTLAGFDLLTTADMVPWLEANQLPVTALPELAAGGDIGVAAKVLEKGVSAVIFFVDPEVALTAIPSLPLLLRACHSQQIPLGMNPATANLVLRGLARSRVAYLIFNPVSGQGNPNQDLATIRTLLEPQILVNTILTQPNVDPVDQAKEAIAAIQSRSDHEFGPGLIIASGGDGTVSAVASAVIGTDIPLGVIPRGTANAFSVALNIPNTLEGACETILAGHTRLVDTARCNDTPMILLAGLGFEAGMVDRASRELKNRLGALAYLLAGAQQLADQQPFDAHLDIDGEISELQPAAITIANVAPPTSVLAQGFGQVVPDDGLLDVTIATSQNRLQGLNALASLIASAVVQAPTQRDDLLCLRTRRIRVTTNPPQKLVVDGEMLDANPIEFECLPQSLRVYVPLPMA
jgi:diacylglycerol kinase (ATP)